MEFDKVVFPPRRSVLENVMPKRWLLPVFLACLTFVLLAAGEASAQNNSSFSWWPFGHSTPEAPAPPPLDDAISVKPTAKPTVELYLAIANLQVQSNQFAKAEEQYQQAMKIAKNDIRVLLGYAMLKDQMNQPQEALEFYQKAEQKYPKEPSVYNNLAVHYARCNMIREAIEAAQHAVALRPREPRYRNNLAALLVEAGMFQEAFKQLREVYDEPVAHYDLAFLLNKRGLKPAALQEFTVALRLSPGMTLARQWVERLSQERGEGSPAAMGMMPPPGQTPGGVAPDLPYVPREAARPPMPPSPPQYAVPPQYPNPAPPAPVQYPVQPPPPAQVQYPVRIQYPAGPPPNVGPQNPQPGPVPQNAGQPQVQRSIPATPPAANPPPAMSAQDPPPAATRVNPPPVGNDGTVRRLPPVSDAGNAANSNRDPQGPDLVAPDPPGWRR
jgi:Flp pilus assembly protein TadD